MNPALDMPDMKGEPFGPVQPVADVDLLRPLFANPGISMRFGTQELTKARRTLEDNGEHFTYFLKISNNRGRDRSHHQCYKTGRL